MLYCNLLYSIRTTDVMYKDEFNKQKHVPPGLDSPEDLDDIDWQSLMYLDDLRT